MSSRPAAEFIVSIPLRKFRKLEAQSYGFVRIWFPSL